MQPPLRAPLAVLSSSDLIRSPSALMRAGPAGSLPRGAGGVLSPINELTAAARGGHEMVPDTQSIDGSPLCPTVAPVATQCSQAQQRIASQALAKMRGQRAPQLQPASAASSPQPQPNACCPLTAAGCSGQGTPDSTQHLTEEAMAAASQQQGAAATSASMVLAGTRADRSRSYRAASQMYAGSQTRTARKRASCEITADIPVQSAVQHEASEGRDKSSRRSKGDSCVRTPDSGNNSIHLKFQPPICDSQPKEVFAIVSSKKRRITATCVQTCSRAKTAFRMAGMLDADALDKVSTCACCFHC